MAIVELKDVEKVYPLGKPQVHALRGVTLTVEKGDFVSIAGPSGSGKSTILNLLGCVDTATSGTVRVNGTDTAKLSDREITRLRHEVLGFIFQSFNLIPVLNVFENVEFPLLLGESRVSKTERREWVEHLIEAVGLSKWRTHKPSELSGGQRQRVAIARALATKPSIVETVPLAATAASEATICSSTWVTPSRPTPKVVPRAATRMLGRCSSSWSRALTRHAPGRA